MAEAGRDLILKVLSGPHMGAEIALVPGEYRLGRDPACDIVLSDSSMAPEHALLVVGPDGLRVQNLAGEVRVGNAPHGDPAVPVPLGQLISLGTTQIAVGPEGSKWPEPFQPGPASGTPAAVETRAESDARPDGASTREPSQATTAPPPPARSNRVPILVGLVVLAAILTAPLSVHMNDATAIVDPKTVEPHAPRLQELFAGLLGKQPIQGSVWVVTPPGVTPQVHGYVSDATQQKLLNDLVKQLPEPVQMRVYLQDQMLEAAEQTLAALGRQLQVTIAGPGELAVAGYLPDASDLQRIVDLLQRDVAGLKAVRNDVLTNRSVMDTLQRDIDKMGLRDALRLRLEADKIIARGVLKSEEMIRWTEVARQFDEKYGRYLGLASQVTENVREQPAALPGIQLQIRAVRAGSVPYVTLADGQKYLEGSTLPGGWTILKISRTEIILARAGQQFVHQL